MAYRIGRNIRPAIRKRFLILQPPERAVFNFIAMKKILFILLSTICFAQNVKLTIYKNGYPQTNEYTVPLTYHDSRDVGPKIQAFCNNILDMSLDEMDFYTYMQFYLHQYLF